MDLHQNKQPVLYLIICAAPPAQQMQQFISIAQADGWDVCVIATPQATRFIKISELTALTGHQVRSDYKLPGEADPLPKADAMLVMPATFNTLNKLALGIGDTLAISILCESLGRGSSPIIVVPYLKLDLAYHPAFSKSLALLKESGVSILYDPEKYPSPILVPWEIVLEELHRICGKN